jgi:hypothetical protein
VKSPLYGDVSEQLMMGIIYPFFCRYTDFRLNDRNVYRDLLSPFLFFW